MEEPVSCSNLTKLKLNGNNSFKEAYSLDHIIYLIKKKKVCKQLQLK